MDWTAPLPWKTDDVGLTLVDATGMVVARFQDTRGKIEPEEANIRLVLRAVNRYGTLMDLCQRSRRMLDARWSDDTAGAGPVLTCPACGESKRGGGPIEHGPDCLVPRLDAVLANEWG